MRCAEARHGDPASPRYASPPRHPQFCAVKARTGLTKRGAMTEPLICFNPFFVGRFPFRQLGRTPRVPPQGGHSFGPASDRHRRLSGVRNSLRRVVARPRVTSRPEWCVPARCWTLLFSAPFSAAACASLYCPLKPEAGMPSQVGHPSFSVPGLRFPPTHGIRRWSHLVSRKYGLICQ